MAYIPTAADFDDVPSVGYRPTAADFDDATPSSVAPGLLQRLSQTLTGGIQSVAKETAKSPTLSKLLQGAGNAVQPFNESVQAGPLPAISRGILQGGGDTASSVLNVIPEISNATLGTNLKTLQMPDLSQYASGHDDPYAALLGNVIGGSILPGAGYSRLKEAIPAMSGALKYVPSLAAGAGAGYATGENFPGGRAVSTVLGGGIAPFAEAVPNAIKSIKNAFSLKDQLKSSGNDIKDMLGDTSERASKGALVNVLTKAYNATREKFNGLYDDMRNGTIGQKKIINPLTAEDLGNLKVGALSNETRAKLPQMVGRIGRKVESKSGKSFQMIGAKAPEANVGDYMQLSKQLRDEAADLRGKASGDDTNQYEKEALLGRANQIDDLRATVTSRMHNSLTDDEIAQMSKLDKDYKDQYIPFKSDPAIRKAITQQRVGNGSFFNKVNQPANEGWLKYMQSSPWSNEYREAITNHDLMNLNLKSLPKMSQVVNGDLMDSLTSNAQTKLLNHYGNLENKESLKDWTNILEGFKKSAIPTLGAAFGLHQGSKVAHEILGSNEQ